MGPTELLLANVIGLMMMGGVSARLFRGRSGSLVIQRFSLASPSDPGGASVEIVGRAQGFTGFVLSLIGFSPITRFGVTVSEVQCKANSLWGENSQFIPLRCVTMMSAGVHKPVVHLVWAVLVLVSSLSISTGMSSAIPFIVGLLLAVVCVIWYVITRKFYLDIYTQGGPPISLLFQPNVIEGVPIDVEQALEVVDLIRELMVQASTPMTSSVSSPRTSPMMATPTAAVEPAPVEMPRPPVPVAPTRLPLKPRTPAPVAPPPPPYDSPALQGEDDDDERQAKHWYLQARQYSSSGQLKLAIATMEQLVKRFPNTQTAELARQKLERGGR